MAKYTGLGTKLSFKTEHFSFELVSKGKKILKSPELIDSVWRTGTSGKQAKNTSNSREKAQRYVDNTGDPYFATGIFPVVGVLLCGGCSKKPIAVYTRHLLPEAEVAQ
jgi:hypothetical protein